MPYILGILTYLKEVVSNNDFDTTSFFVNLLV
jgi:hypothetical protein